MTVEVPGNQRQPGSWLRLPRARPRARATPWSRRSSPTGSRCASPARARDEVPLDERHLVVRAMRAAFEAMDAPSPGPAPGLHQPDPAQPWAGLLVGGHRRRHRAGAGPGRGRCASPRRRCGALAGQPARGSSRQRRACAARRVRDQRPGRRRRVGPAVAGRPVGVGGGVRAAVRRPDRGRARAAPGDRAPRATRPPTAVARPCWSRRWRRSPPQLLRATEDFLHQRQREPAMPESLALVDRPARTTAFRPSSPVPVPTVLAFVTDDAEVVAATRSAGWRSLRQRLGGPGAAVLM